MISFVSFVNSLRDTYQSSVRFEKVEDHLFRNKKGYRNHFYLYLDSVSVEYPTFQELNLFMVFKILGKSFSII